MLKDSAVTDIISCIKAVAAGQDYTSPELNTLTQFIPSSERKFFLWIDRPDAPRYSDVCFARIAVTGSSNSIDRMNGFMVPARRISMEFSLLPRINLNRVLGVARRLTQPWRGGEAQSRS